MFCFWINDLGLGFRESIDSHIPMYSNLLYFKGDRNEEKDVYNHSVAIYKFLVPPIVVIC